MSRVKLAATKVTPNMIGSRIEKSLVFDALGFTRGMTVPEHSPFVFASVTSGPVETFLDDPATESAPRRPVELSVSCYLAY